MADLVFPGEDSSTTLNSGAMPQNIDLEIYKGDYVRVFVVILDEDDTPKDLTGYTARASLKLDYEDDAPIDFTCTVTGEPGEVEVYLPSALSSTLIPGSYIWDIEIVDGDGDSRTYFTGDVTVYDEVTTA
jgi:hypothetical protein